MSTKESVLIYHKRESDLWGYTFGKRMDTQVVGNGLEIQINVKGNLWPQLAMNVEEEIDF